MNLIDKLNSQLNDHPDEGSKVLCNCTLYPEDHRVAKRTRYTRRSIYPRRSALSSQQSAASTQSITSNDAANGTQHIEGHNSGDLEDIREVEEELNSPPFDSRLSDEENGGLEADAD